MILGIFEVLESLSARKLYIVIKTKNSILKSLKYILYFIKVEAEDNILCKTLC